MTILTYVLISNWRRQDLYFDMQNSNLKSADVRYSTNYIYCLSETGSF